MLITDLCNNQAVVRIIHDTNSWYVLALIYEAGKTLIEPGIEFLFSTGFNSYDISYSNNIHVELQTYYTSLVE